MSCGQDIAPAGTKREDPTSEQLAFYDINPQAKVHFLVIPKKHITSAAVLTEEDGALLGHIFAVIAKLAKEQKHFQQENSSLFPLPSSFPDFFTSS